MKIIKRIIIAFLLLGLLIVIAAYLYLLTTKPTLDGSLQLPGLKAEVEVLYDEWGIPHIYAQHEEDAYYALGYVHAQDRLFQMEMLRRAASGRLAEVLGPDLVEVDKFFRTLGINHFAKEHATKFLSGDTAAYQRAAHAYQKGVNHFVYTGRGPIEFSIMGIPKQAFTPEDIYLAVGFMSFGFAEGFHADPVLQKIKTEWGDEYLKDLSVQTPPDAVIIKNHAGEIKSTVTDQLISKINAAIEKIPVPLLQGSNGWVVSGEKSVSGFPILANDTHIGFGQPAVWYEAHMEYPSNSFYGHHLAGIPFGLLGNNRYCGFGLTMFENDDVDFFVELPNEDSTAVKFQDSWELLQTRTEVIKVSGADDIHFPVKSSRHGSIINGIVENVGEAGNPIALAWQLLLVENMAVQAAYQLNHASTFAEAREAVSKFSAPGLNVMYADTDGNIAWWAAAKLPVRPPHVQSKLFLDGASGNDEYQGYYDFSKNPQAVNPPWGFVYSANNQPDTVDGILYPGYYYPKSRAGRIYELLSAEKKFSGDNMKTIQLDVTSHQHAETARIIAEALNAYADDADLAVIVRELKNWTGEHSKTLIAPSIYYNMLSQITYRSMQDEIGVTALKSLHGTSVPKNSYHTFIANASSPWWDDVRTTDKKESREDILVESARETVRLLKKICGNKPEQWTWGKLHTLTHPHAFKDVKPLNKFFNVGPFAVDGGNEVLNNLLFSLDTTGYFPVQGGPALRKVTDFANLEQGETVSPTGQSGNVMSAYYDDQAEKYATGQYRKMMMNREEIVDRKKHKLILKP
ncbi:MAG: penicillin acylase family protein [Cyclobacteriaceae bacterium]|nr:penicillin acylase family protein [Cyclobacteriaceae bacterium]